MITKMIGFLARIAIGKQLVVIIAKVHNALDGHRSEIALGILALVHGLKLAGIIPADTADGIEKALAAILPLTLADRAAKFIAIADRVIPEVPKAAPTA